MCNCNTVLPGKEERENKILKYERKYMKMNNNE